MLSNKAVSQNFFEGAVKKEEIKISETSEDQPI
jgi:hypothetical protein